MKSYKWFLWIFYANSVVCDKDTDNKLAQNLTVPMILGILILVSGVMTVRHMYTTMLPVFTPWLAVTALLFLLPYLSLGIFSILKYEKESKSILIDD